MIRLAELFPEMAARERRSVILRPGVPEKSQAILPSGEYALDELYCEEAGCDCRRVVINVWWREAKAHVATINHAFEPPSPDALVPEQTFLDPLNPQTKWSAALLDLFVNVVLLDRSYRERLERHYRIFKNAIEDAARNASKQTGQRGMNGATSSAIDRSPTPPPPRRGKRKWR